MQGVRKTEGGRDGNGTPGWDRTSGFQLRRLTLYPLSYGRTIIIKSEVLL